MSARSNRRADPLQAGERMIPYRPGLDGLRGLSVAAVLAFHGGFTWAVGGFLGVSVFFTLSGFLITSLLLAEFERKGRIDLRHFWGRRFRRLLPASLVALAGIGVFGLTVATAEQAETLGGDIVAALAYVANWRFIFGDTSYGALFAEPTPVLHFWSLAIEEQFYLVYPPLMVGLLAVARGKRWVVAGVLTALFVASVTATLVMGTGNLDRIYFGTDTRAAELLAGALLAIAVLGSARRLGQSAGLGMSVAGLGAIAMLGYLVVTVDGSSLWLYQGGFAAVSVLSVVAILGATREGPLATALGISPLRWLGTRSYGLYLFHWPIFLWLDPATTGIDGTPLFLLRLAVTAVVTEVSYHVIEHPIRYAHPLPRPALTAAPIAIVVVVVLGVASTGTAPEPLVDLRQTIERVPAPPVVVTSPPEEGPAVVVVGDSLAPAIASELADTLPRRTGWRVVDATEAECPLSGDRPPQCRDVASRWIEASDGADLVVVSIGVGEPPTPGRSSLTPDIADRVAELRAGLGDSARIVWVNQPLVLAPGDTPALDIDPEATAWPHLAQLNDVVAVAALEGGDDLIDLARYLRFSELNNGTGVSILDHDDDRIILGLGWIADQVVEMIGDDVEIGPDTIRILVLGDSVAYSLGRGLEQWTTEDVDAVVWNAGTTGCGILRDGEIPDYEIRPSPVCSFWPERFTAHLDDFDPHVVLMVSTGWDLLERRLPGWPGFLTAGAGPFDEYMLSEYRAAVDVVSSSGAAVAWSSSPCVSAQRAVGGSVFEQERTARQNELIVELTSTDDRVVLIDVNAVVCPGGEFTDRVDGISNFRPDGVHFSDPGSLWVARRIGPELLALAVSDRG